MFGLLLNGAATAADVNDRVEQVVAEMHMFIFYENLNEKEFLAYDSVFEILFFERTAVYKINTRKDNTKIRMLNKVKHNLKC
jgi:hypothetical protein